MEKFTASDLDFAKIDNQLIDQAIVVLEALQEQGAVFTETTTKRSTARLCTLNLRSTLRVHSRVDEARVPQRCRDSTRMDPAMTAVQPAQFELRQAVPISEMRLWVGEMGWRKMMLGAAFGSPLLYLEGRPSTSRASPFPGVPPAT